MAVIFLDQDDEITTAIARLRASEDIKVALVLAPGSRLGTSRINFRLLAREAQGLPRQASIVTTEAGVRAIAVSAGLPAYASVAEYEAAIGAAASAAATSVAGAAAAAASAAGVAAPGEAGAPVAAEPAVPGEAGAPVAAEPAVPGEAGESVAAEPPAPAEAGASGEAAAVTAAAAAAAGLVLQPPLETPPAAPAKRSRSSKKADKAAAAAIAAGAATGDVAQTGVPPPSGAVEDEPAPGEPGQGGAGVGRPDEPMVVTDAAILGAGAEAAETTQPPDSAGATAAADAAAASAFGAEIAAVPPPPRGPGPRSSAALPVVGGPVRSTGVLGGRGALVGVLAVIAAVGVVAIALAVLVLPQATITVAPPIEQVGPVSLTVTADPTAIEPDAATGIIPAQLVTIPLAAEGDFTATGVKVTETEARGSVTFSNLDAANMTTIPAGSVVSTDANVRFRTLASVRVPKAKIKGFTIDPGRASVRIEAVKAGPNGNVAANAIQNVPSGYDPVLLKVTNPAETSGGERSESTRVSQEDVDVAVAELTRELEDQMAAALADPATAPAGTTLIEETAETGRIRSTPAPDNLVGRSVQTFKLSLSATGEVISVDTGVLEPLASGALTAAVPEGAVLFPESITTTVGSPTVDGGVVSFEIGATGQAWRPLDEVALLEQVRGRSVLEAEDALAEYGEVAIDVWPFYVATIPEGDRATLTVIPPTPSGP